MQNETSSDINESEKILLANTVACKDKEDMDIISYNQTTPVLGEWYVFFSSTLYVISVCIGMIISVLGNNNASAEVKQHQERGTLNICAEVMVYFLNSFSKA